MLVMGVWSELALPKSVQPPTEGLHLPLHGRYPVKRDGVGHA